MEKTVLFRKLIDLNQNIRQLPELVKNIKAAGFRLAADLSKTSGSEIIVEGLVRMDVMQFLKPIQQINCMRGRFLPG